MKNLYLFITILTLIAVKCPLSSQEKLNKPSPWLVQQPSDYDTAENVIKAQIAAIKSGDSTKAYYAYTTKEFRKSFSLEDFKLFARNFKVFYQNRSMIVENTELEGSSIIKLKAKLVANDGDTMAVKYDLVLEDDEWKVHNIQLTQYNPRSKFLRPPGPSAK